MWQTSGDWEQPPCPPGRSLLPTLISRGGRRPLPFGTWPPLPGDTFFPHLLPLPVTPSPLSVLLDLRSLNLYLLMFILGFRSCSISSWSAFLPLFGLSKLDPSFPLQGRVSSPPWQWCKDWIFWNPLFFSKLLLHLLSTSYIWYLESNAIRHKHIFSSVYSWFYGMSINVERESPLISTPSQDIKILFNMHSICGKEHLE